MKKLLLAIALLIGSQLTLNAQACNGSLTVNMSGAATNLLLTGIETHMDLECNALDG